MEWSPDQETALTRISEWLKRGGSPRFSLGGYAGTGKTTLAKHIAENHGGDVKFGAFTGKAASVLRSKGCPGATTIHKLIYQPKGSVGETEIEELQNLIQTEALKRSPDEEKLRVWRRDLERKTADSSAIFERKIDCEIQEASLVIIDESSMVDRRMGNDLESYGIPILYLGDPGQLPPVRGKAHLGPNDYDYVLEEIHRQAKDSPIIWLANEVRHDRGVRFGDYGDGLVKILRKSEWDWDTITGADQVITGTNQSRYRITRGMRSHIGFTQVFPLPNDKLICRKNDHEKLLLNGVTCRSLTEGRKKGNIIYLDVEYDGRRETHICDPGYFQEHYGERTHFPKGDGIQHFDYGYCITGHKSQGSQWRHVVVADDRMRANDREQRRKWLYTVFTRAEEQLTYYV
ncbi:MAG TPA: AAA family ATPase [Acidimicrobiia bacterium]